MSLSPKHALRTSLALLAVFSAVACNPEPRPPLPAKPRETPQPTRPPSVLAAALPPNGVPVASEPPASPSTQAVRPALDVVNTRREPRRHPRTVGELIEARQCSTGPAFRLNAQIAAEVNCIAPGAFAYIDDIPNAQLNHGANPFLQSAAADALRRVAATAPHAWFALNSTWRSAAQQHILKRWEGSCGIGLAAPVGQSNHESGLAIDLPLKSLYGYHAELAAEGWRWFCATTNRGALQGCRDAPHHDLRGTDLRRFGVQAFQRLWNHAHPTDPIRVTGRFDPATAQRMERAPLAGFPTGTTCGLAFPTRRCPATFADVSPRHPQLAAIEATARAGLWSLCEPGRPDAFCPDASLSRAEFAATLARALDLTEATSTERFQDVPTDHPDAGWIEAIARSGVSPGCRPLKGPKTKTGAPRFCPDAPVTRSQVAAWLTRALNLPHDANGERFEDVPKDYWAAAEVEAFDHAGLELAGCRSGRFCPGSLPKRAQLASLLVEAFQLPAVPACERSLVQASMPAPHPTN